MKDVRVVFASREGPVRAVDSISLTLAPGDRLALIGESGCGKTVLGMAVLGLLPPNAEVAGEVWFEGKNLLRSDREALRRIRGKEIAMVMQNSVQSLNPVQPVGRQIAEPLLVHSIMGRDEAREAAERLLTAMGFDDPARALLMYPHEFSGGMRERILIAMALVCNPLLLIADEPTAGLDAEVKLQILQLLREQIMDCRTLLLITHDLGTAKFLSTRIAVMYAGEIVETGLSEHVLAHPMHPYTQGILASLPSAGLHPIPGISPSPGCLPEGCRFAGRCPVAEERCRKNHPEMLSCGDSRQVRCRHYA